MRPAAASLSPEDAHGPYEEMCRQHPGAGLSEKSIGKAFEYVYGVLSHEIHGYPWSDESVDLMLILML